MTIRVDIPKSFLCICLLPWALLIHGQKLLIPEQNGFQGRFFNYRINSPGADITTTRLYFDRKGFLWSGTYTGLYRFDGHEYKSFFTNSNDSSGLAGNQVIDIYENQSGFLWIGSLGALNCLDQKSWTFKHYFPDSTDLMSIHNRIRKIFEDRNGKLWILTCGDIFAFNLTDRKFKRYPLDTLCYIEEITLSARKGSFLEDSSGRIWIATSYGLCLYDNQTDNLKVFKNIPGNNASLSGNLISSISEDRWGNLWCSATDGGLMRIIDPEKGVFERINLRSKPEVPESFNSILTILPDSKGRIWTFGEGTFSSYDPAGKIIKNYIVPEPKKLLSDSKFDEIRFNSAFEDSYGNIWFLHSLEGFMFRLNPETEKLVLFFVPNWSVFDCITDDIGSFWFACGANNCWRLVVRDLPYTSISVNNRYAVNSVKVNRIAEDDYFTWFLFSSGIFRSGHSDLVFNLKQFIFKRGSNNASCIYNDRNGRIWFAKEKGIITRMEKDGNKFTEFLLPENHPGPVSDIIEDQTGNYWFISPYNVFLLPYGENSIRIFNFENSDLVKYILGGLYNVTVDSRNRMWFASFGNGVYSYDINDKEVKYYTPGSETELRFGDYCLRVDEDSEGNIWLLYFMKGLFMLNPEKKESRNIRLFDNSEGRTDYFDLYADKNANIIVAHTKGFTFFNNKKGTVRNINFRQPAGNSQFFSSYNGNLYYLSGSNLLLFSDSLPMNLNIPPVYITSVLAGKKEYNLLYPDEPDISSLTKIRLKHSQNDIRISFTALNYLEPQYNMYRYFMKGIDKDTVLTTSKERFSEYKKTKPGRYEFWVTGSNNDGVWNKTGRTLIIEISPPWFESKLAYLLYLLSLSASILLIINIRSRKLRNEKEYLESVVRKRTAELEEKNRRIEELDSLKTRFFSEISHEIRTPLSLIAGPVDNLIREQGARDDERKRKWMELIKRNSSRILKLANQLLDISKLDSGNMKLVLEESDIIAYLRTIAYEYFSLAEIRKINYTVQVPDKTFITFFDSDKLEKIFSNLLSNAFKFTPLGGNINCAIDINIRQNEPPLLKIQVSDTGSGIKKENISRIFDRFYRVRGEWESDGSGVGIGLSITREFVKLMHGEINVTSEHLKGTIFSLIIPVGYNHLRKDEYELAKKNRNVDTDYLESFEDYNGYEDKEIGLDDDINHVLLVEDNRDLRIFIKENLGSGYFYHEADNGKDGLKIAFEIIPDMVITDIIMPDLNGNELCRILKNDERTSHIPIIMLTARSSVEDKIKGLRSGADDYLSKPFDIDELKIRLRNLLKQREMLRLKYGMLTGLENHTGKSVTQDDRLMNKITRLINENLRDFNFDVGVLQEKVGMSRVHLYRKIKAITGLSPSILIRNIRMKQAALLIRQQEGSISDVAFSIGFTNPSYFSRCFREFYGVLPRDFIDRYKNDQGPTDIKDEKKISR